MNSCLEGFDLLICSNECLYDLLVTRQGSLFSLHQTLSIMMDGCAQWSFLAQQSRAGWSDPISQHTTLVVSSTWQISTSYGHIMDRPV